VPSLRRCEEPPGERHGEEADRQVDEEDPAPADLVDDRTADHRAEDRGEQHRHADDTHDATQPLRPRSLGEDRLSDGHQQAAAKTLEHAEDDERLDRPSRPRKRGAGHEREQRANPDALHAEAFPCPGGEGDHACEREQVPRHHPLDR
jgi:hypothetical protein